MRVVLDVGTSLAWQRPPVGIVRTEHQFARHLLATPSVETVFCRFDRARGVHVTVPSDVVGGLLGHGMRAGDAPSPPPSSVEVGTAAAVADGMPLRHRMRGLLASAFRRSIERLPESARYDAALAARGAEQLAKGLYWLTAKPVRAAFERRRSLPFASPANPDAAVAAADAVLRFAEDDVYVSMGLDWEYNDLEAVASAKRRVGFRSILYCYDLIPVRYPHLMSFDARQFFARYFVNVAHAADHVVAISRATIEDYRGFLQEVGAPLPDMSVMYLGTDVAHRADEPRVAPQADLADTPFVLCVGTIEARKNHELLYNVWDRLASRRGSRTPRLVVVGMPGWGVADLLSRIRLNRAVSDTIVVLPHVDDGGLAWLYEHCLFTVYPSFVEGWGLPVVESLAVGKPCLASNARAVVEATQGLVPTLDPLDFPAWLQHVERWLDDPDALRAAERRLRDFRAPSWRQHGDAMLALVRNLSGEALCASCI